MPKKRVVVSDSEGNVVSSNVFEVGDTLSTIHVDDVAGGGKQITIADTSGKSTQSNVFSPPKVELTHTIMGNTATISITQEQYDLLWNNKDTVIVLNNSIYRLTTANNYGRVYNRINFSTAGSISALRLYTLTLSPNSTSLAYMDDSFTSGSSSGSAAISLYRHELVTAILNVRAGPSADASIINKFGNAYLLDPCPDLLDMDQVIGRESNVRVNGYPVVSMDYAEEDTDWIEITYMRVKFISGVYQVVSETGYVMMNYFYDQAVVAV